MGSCFFGVSWYDYGARFYDPSLARFHSLDPISENYNFQSPYAYAANNPITFIDYNGLGPWDYVKGIGIGIGSGAKGTWNFVTSSAWKADTWKATGNLALGLAAMGPNGTGASNLVAVDAALGTNTAGAVEGLSTAIDQGVDKFVSGSDQDRGEVIGEVIWGVAEAVAGSKGAGMLSKSKTVANAASKVEVVERAMSKAELVATKSTGLLRGGRDGTHYVSNAVNNTARKAQKRLALPVKPEVKVRMEVPSGRFSNPSKVDPAFGQAGGGMERTATGNVPVRILKEWEYKK